jgi:hypothetical protein
MYPMYLDTVCDWLRNRDLHIPRAIGEPLVNVVDDRTWNWSFGKGQDKYQEGHGRREGMVKLS